MNESQDKVNILLVDDNEEKLTALEAVLGELGQNIVKARSGREALRCLLTEDFAVILLDVNMPGLNGFETAELIRQRRSCENTPIIFITAYGDEVFVERGYSLGAVDYILTPIVPDVLRTKVMVFVDLHRQTEQIRRQAASLRRRTEQLRALAGQLTQVEQRERRRLAQVLHDHLQQLLVAAKMRVDMARSQGGESRVCEALAGVEELLNESINVSRSLTLDLSPPILHDAGLVRALEWLGRRMHEEHGLAVHVESRGPTLDLHESLRVLLFEAARELLFNIVKHSGVREARICIAACDDRGVRMTVADQGRGIDPSVAAAGDPEGFGLFSLRERLSLIEGHLQIDSEPGRGTRVVIEAPLGPGAPGEETAAHEAAATPALRLVEPPEPELPASAPRVILADDHEVLRKGLASLLTQHGVAVVGEACDGEQAVALAVQLSPDVVVMDVSMPRLNGVEATRRLRAARPAVRVIGLSMHDSAEMASAMMSAGATAYLNKAGPPDQLVAAIRTARAAVEEVRARHA